MQLGSKVFTFFLATGHTHAHTHKTKTRKARLPTVHVAHACDLIPGTPRKGSRLTWATQ